MPTARKTTLDQKRASRDLQRLPNVGPAIAGDLLRLGVTSPRQLARRDPVRMYATLCRLDGVRHDPCLLDVFAAIVAHARGGPARPWWEFSRARKRREGVARG
jgi:hypothetical protein